MTDTDLHAVEAAITVLNANGFDIASPRDGDLDGLEQERFNAVTDACRAYLSAVGGEAGTLEVVTKQFDEALRRQQELEREITGLRNSYAGERRQRLFTESELARLKAQPGVVKALEDLAQRIDADGTASQIGSAEEIREILAALAAPVSQEPVGGSAAGSGCAFDNDHLAWACERWQREVANRPLRNVHRRTLDDTWRQVIRRLGGNPDILLPMAGHDTLVSENPAAAVRSPITEGEPSDAEVERADFLTEIGRSLPEDFPNYADWPITLPAGHWRRLAALLASPTDADAAVEWRSMDSAPGDEETPVLLWINGQCAVGLTWKRRDGTVIGKASMFGNSIAEYWMPLPAAPLTAAKAGEDGRHG